MTISHPSKPCDFNPIAFPAGMDKIPANFTIAYDAEGVSATAFKIKGMPSSYLIDRTGKITFSHIGFRDKEVPAMEQKIKQLLKK